MHGASPKAHPTPKSTPPVRSGGAPPRRSWASTFLPAPLAVTPPLQNPNGEDAADRMSRGVTQHFVDHLTGSRRDAPCITVGVTHPMPGQVKIPGARRGPHNTLRGDARCITARESLSAARRLLDRPRGRVLPLSRPSVMHGASSKAYPTPNRAESIPQERGGWHVGGDAPCITARAVR